MAETREMVYVCGGAGTLTPEAQLELEQFGWHLKYHRPRNLTVEGCRFCAERQRPSSTPSSDGRTRE